MTERRRFLASVRQALGRSSGAPPRPAPGGASVSEDELGRMALQVRAVMAERAAGLLDELAAAASRAGWVVHRAASNTDAAAAVTGICVDAGARHVLKSGEASVLALSGLSESLNSAGIEVEPMVRPDEETAESREEAARLRASAFETDVGITGSDYAIAETGTVVIHPRRGLSRLISLAPPRHVAVVRKGTVLPSLDELFLLEREAQASGTLASSMNLITGPSRTGDIEAVIVTGIHGPVEVHAVLVDQEL